MAVEVVLPEVEVAAAVPVMPTVADNVAPLPAVMSVLAVPLAVFRKPPSLPLKMADAVEVSVGVAISPTFRAVAEATPVTDATIWALLPTVAVELTSPATLVTEAAALAVPLVELAIEVALAATGYWIVESDPAVNGELRAPIAEALSAMGWGGSKKRPTPYFHLSMRELSRVIRRCTSND